MSALLSSALNICTVMSYFMCLKVVDAGHQQLSLLATAFKILKGDVLASACCGGPEEGSVSQAKAAEVQLWYLRRMSSYHIFLFKAFQLSKIYWAIIFKNNWPVQLKKSNATRIEIYVTKRVRVRKEKNVVINQGKEKEQAQAVMQRDWFS